MARLSPASAGTWCSTSPRACAASPARRRCRRCSSLTASPTCSPIRWSGADAAQGRGQARGARRRHADARLPRGGEPTRTRGRLDLPFPLFVKPVAEGTGKGIDGRLAGRDHAGAGRPLPHRCSSATASRCWSSPTCPAASSRSASSAPAPARGCSGPSRSCCAEGAERDVYSLREQGALRGARASTGSPSGPLADEASALALQAWRGARLPRRRPRRLPPRRGRRAAIPRAQPAAGAAPRALRSADPVPRDRPALRRADRRNPRFRGQRRSSGRPRGRDRPRREASGSGLRLVLLHGRSPATPPRRADTLVQPSWSPPRCAARPPTARRCRSTSTWRRPAGACRRSAPTSSSTWSSRSTARAAGHLAPCAAGGAGHSLHAAAPAERRPRDHRQAAGQARLLAGGPSDAGLDRAGREAAMRLARTRTPLHRQAGLGARLARHRRRRGRRGRRGCGRVATRAARCGGHFAERFVDGREFNLALLGSRRPSCCRRPRSCSRTGPTDKPRIVGYAAKWDGRVLRVPPHAAALRLPGRGPAAAGAGSAARPRLLAPVRAARLRAGRLPRRCRRAALDPRGQRQPLPVAGRRLRRRRRAPGSDARACCERIVAARSARCRRRRRAALSHVPHPTHPRRRPARQPAAIEQVQEILREQFPGRARERHREPARAAPRSAQAPLPHAALRRRDCATGCRASPSCSTRRTSASGLPRLHRQRAPKSRPRRRRRALRARARGGARARRRSACSSSACPTIRR